MTPLGDSLLVKRWNDTTPLPGASGIYSVYCVVNRQTYIGSAADLRNRFYTHRRTLRQGCHHSVYLQRAYDKYGPESLIFYVLEFVSKSELLIREQSYLDKYSPRFNMAPTAHSRLGMRCSVSAKEKLRRANLGKKLTPANRAIALNNLQPNRKGRHRHTAKTRLKMSVTRQQNPPMGMLGKTHSQATKEKFVQLRQKTYRFVDPQGQTVVITNLAKFCMENKLHRSHMYAVHSTARKSHKGWTVHTRDELQKVRMLLEAEPIAIEEIR